MRGTREHSTRRAAGPAVIVLATAVLTAVVVGVVALAEALRPPPSATTLQAPELDLVPDDPREPVRCADAVPREGEARETTAGAATVVLDVSTPELLDCPQAWDGRRIRLRGEVLGPVLAGPDGTWVRLNDDAYGVALGPLPAHRTFHGQNRGVAALLPPALAADVAVVGGPKTAGDVIVADGVFHRVDATTGEVAVLRVIDGAVTQAGGPVAAADARGRAAIALVLVPVTLAVVVAERVYARRA